MSFNAGKLIITLLMLLTFTGQAVAYNIAPCTMHDPVSPVSSQMTTAMAHAQSGSGHSEHTSGLSAHSHDNMAQDDCDNTCCCPMGSCVSLGLTTGGALDEIFAGSYKISQRQNLMPGGYPASLYRPPILG